MACAGCGAKYKRVSSAGRQRLNVPTKYGVQQKPSKKPAATATPRKIDPQIAIGLMSSIANSMPK